MTQQEAIKLSVIIEQHVSQVGYHVALTGGCLYRNGDRKDADFILYPHKPDKTVDRDTIKQALGTAGFVDFFETDIEYTNREILLSKFAGRRCDFFFLT
jgi:hypothetical protein